MELCYRIYWTMRLRRRNRKKEENRYICLNIGVEQNMIHLVVSNYISESVLQNNALLETSKKKISSCTELV